MVVVNYYSIRICIDVVIVVEIVIEFVFLLVGSLWG